ncbi:hypothetical protein [Bradyrhizobium sp. JYMT SZCCT0428]|uniref:hypothetical protein n=1 Tax=Bradyrhizobium sp. JYMT SZCCT0428 TaxID=2807673 RepID=UPI001BAA1072|nr:hypothetical protein [Bradyrhizobium sp. JYMT SZCCT0428]MBR1156196.1 hypothetical protein [Bradyrhizobium sp. JYMT SZCCT0428]
MSVRNVEARIIKLEALQPAPSSPLDGMISDELTVMLLELYADVLASNALAEEKTEAAREQKSLRQGIATTVNFASGRWAKPPGFENYQEHIASMKAYWHKLQADRGEYVPSLNCEIETDGFGFPGRGEPPVPDLMVRRAKLWQHPIVKQIVEDAPNAQLGDSRRSLFHECKSFKAGRAGEPSGDCGHFCRNQCINARRGGWDATRSRADMKYIFG